MQKRVKFYLRQMTELTADIVKKLIEAQVEKVRNLIYQ